MTRFGLDAHDSPKETDTDTWLGGDFTVYNQPVNNLNNAVRRLHHQV